MKELEISKALSELHMAILEWRQLRHYESSISSAAYKRLQEAVKRANELVNGAA